MSPGLVWSRHARRGRRAGLPGPEASCPPSRAGNPRSRERSRRGPEWRLLSVPAPNVASCPAIRSARMFGKTSRPANSLEGSSRPSADRKRPRSIFCVIQSIRGASGWSRVWLCQVDGVVLRCGLWIANLPPGAPVAARARGRCRSRCGRHRGEAMDAAGAQATDCRRARMHSVSRTSAVRRQRLARIHSSSSSAASLHTSSRRSVTLIGHGASVVR